MSLTVSGPTASGGRATLVLEGELDIAGTDTLSAALEPLVLDYTGDVRLDVSALTFCDASGIGIIAVAAARISDGGRQFTLDGVSGQLRRLITMVGLHRLIGH